MTITPFCVCVPARDEADRLPRLLDALARQTGVGRVRVALCINNTTDGTRVHAEAVAAAHDATLSLSVVEHTFAPEHAHAGSARAAAMDLGLDILDGEGVLLSTDADARPPAGWVSVNLAAVSAGADLVGGALTLDEDEPESQALQSGWAVWQDYWRQVRAIEDALDPVPWDPAPRHGDHTGASLAITAAAYRAAGGTPRLPTDEDRALVLAAQRAGARLVHPLSVWTRVSARAHGRAQDGMAQAMTRLARQTAGHEPMMAPAFSHWRARALWRRDLRRLPDGAQRIAEAEPHLPPMPLDYALDLNARPQPDGVAP